MGQKPLFGLEYARAVLSTAIEVGCGVECSWIEQCSCRKRPACPWNQGPLAFREVEYLLCNGQGFTGSGKSPFCPVRNAVELLAKSCLSAVGVTEPPVPTSLISGLDQERSVEIRELPLKAYHGGIWCVSDAWVIHLRAEDPLEVKRYTLFHEAFHILCKQVCPAFKRVDLGYKGFNEMLADYFAACILMPREWVEEQWAKVRDISKMAQIFQVPHDLMGLWLERTGSAKGQPEATYRGLDFGFALLPAALRAAGRAVAEAVLVPVQWGYARFTGRARAGRAGEEAPPAGEPDPKEPGQGSKQ